MTTNELTLDERIRASNIKQAQAKLLRSLDTILHQESLESFRIATDDVIGAAQREVIGHARSYIEHAIEAMREGVNLIAYGSIGTGKDHILSSVARAVIDVLADSSAAGTEVVRHVNGPTLWRRYRSFIGKDSSSDDENRIFSEFTRPKILYISDPFQTRGDGTVIKLTDWQIEKLYEIVNYRAGRRLPIFMSINCNSRAEIEAAFNSRIVDRLLGRSIPLHCSWPSYRRLFSGWS